MNKLPDHIRRAVERAIEDSKRGMQLNDGKQRVTLPGGTLEYLLRLWDAAPQVEGVPELDAATEDLINTLRGFARAYPEDVFTPLTPEETKKYSNIVTRASAGMGRHVSKFMAQAADMLELLAAAPQPAQEQEEGLRSALQKIRNGIAADRCDGDTEFADGINTACQKHLQFVDDVLQNIGADDTSRKAALWDFFNGRLKSRSGITLNDESDCQRAVEQWADAHDIKGNYQALKSETDKRQAQTVIIHSTALSKPASEDRRAALSHTNEGAHD